MVDGLLAKEGDTIISNSLEISAKWPLFPFWPSVPSGMLNGSISFFPFSCELLSIADDFRLYPLYSFVKASILKLAFPDNDDGPSLRLQLAPGLLVPFLIPGYLRCPEVGVGLGHRVELAAFVAVPEAAVNEDDRRYLGRRMSGLPGSFLSFIR